MNASRPDRRSSAARVGDRIDVLWTRPGRGRLPRKLANVLVVAIDAVVPAGLAHAEVLVVAPALNSWLRHWLSDEDPARRRAEKRVAALVEQLQRTAAHVEGRVGDADPLQAIADALPTFPADEIVIAARPERSTKLVDDLVFAGARAFRAPHLRAGSRARSLRSARRWE